MSFRRFNFMPQKKEGERLITHDEKIRLALLDAISEECHLDSGELMRAMEKWRLICQREGLDAPSHYW